MKNNPFFRYITSFLKEKLNPKDPDFLSDLGSSFIFPFFPERVCPFSFFTNPSFCRHLVNSYRRVNIICSIQLTFLP